MKRALVIILAILIVLAVMFGVYWQFFGGKQVFLALNVKNRLTRQGITINSVEVLSRDPFTIEINLPAQAEDNPQAGLEHLRTDHLARREAELLNKEKYILSSYVLVRSDEAGKTVDWSQIFLYPQEEVIYEPVYGMDQAEALAYLQEQFTFDEFQVEQFDLEREKRSGQVFYTLKIGLTAENPEFLDQILPSAQIKPVLMGLEKDKLFLVNLCYLEVTSPNGDTWQVYIYDQDIKFEDTWVTKEVSQDWKPQPTDEIQPITILTPAPYPVLSPTTPPGGTSEPSPTQEPYPVDTPMGGTPTIYP